MILYLVVLLIVAVAALSVATTVKLTERINNLQIQVESTAEVTSRIRDTAEKIAVISSDAHDMVDAYSKIVSNYTTTVNDIDSRFAKLEHEIEKVKGSAYQKICEYYAERGE